MVRLLLPALWVVLAASCDDGGSSECPGGSPATIVQVTDGDTFKVSELQTAVRLLGLDTPETNASNAQECPLMWDQMTPEQQDQYNTACCYGEQAKKTLAALLPPGTSVCLANPQGGDLLKDMFGRYLADVYLEKSWVNGKMVASGQARTFAAFPHPTKAAVLDDLQTKAATAGIGLWGFCYEGGSGDGEGPCDQPEE